MMYVGPLCRSLLSICAYRQLEDAKVAKEAAHRELRATHSDARRSRTQTHRQLHSLLMLLAGLVAIVALWVAIAREF